MRALTLILAFTTPILAQQTLDRARIPPPGKPLALHIPSWSTSAAGNGVDIIVSEQHDLPLLSFRITFIDGADQLEPADKRGLAGLTAAMLSEGTTTRDGGTLALSLRRLGAAVDVAVRDDNGSIRFQTVADKFAATLDIVADMLKNSTFPSASLERLRAQRLVTLAQQKAQPDSIADRVFLRILYGPSHPYAQYATEESIKKITRDDVVAFAREYFQPGRAVISIVGDVTPASAKATIERALTGWAKASEKTTFSFPALPDRRPTTIYLVDRPGSAQSTFAIGNPGPPRSTPDYYALRVMNTILGGLPQSSRLNANIREDKGYSYDASSRFGFGRGPGAFRAGANIVSAKSDAALVEFMKELRDIAGSRPVTDQELATAKASLIQGLLPMFASVGGLNDAIASIRIDGLPADYYQQCAKHVGAVTAADVVRAARQYIDLDHLTIVIVGDRASIEGPLKATGVAPVVAVDRDGRVEGSK